ncbi:PREDICTED: GTP-binding protein REM 1-like [Aptenodytes forsteri]|uniref:GTP-binding protein REM 1-like n=1 Tax=Aptenodytes forsteri TaxID=9233 RepID=UPI0004F46EEC|nr:PREDICTED: GTP-binding protein REM 1-like [Aptenodytes forsteri]
MREAAYERTLSVDGEETTLLVMDTWEPEQRPLPPMQQRPAPSARGASGAVPPPCPSLAEGRACAVVFDCKFIETSATLQHNVAELFEGVVRQIRLRRGGKESHARPVPGQKRKESLTKRARRFLDRLVARNSSKVALKVRSKSCHDLSVL